MSLSSTQLLFASVAVMAGIASACQSHMNGTLGHSISDPVGAALWSFVSGTILIACVYIWRGGNLSLQNLSLAPSWAIFGGFMGLLTVVGVIFAVPKVGLFTTIAGVVLGQAVAALLLDALGFWGHGQAISVQRLFAVVLIFAGFVLSKT